MDASWQTDTGTFYGVELLPIVAIHIKEETSMSGAYKVTVGPLECDEGPGKNI